MRQAIMTHEHMEQAIRPLLGEQAYGRFNAAIRGICPATADGLAVTKDSRYITVISRFGLDKFAFCSVQRQQELQAILPDFLERIASAIVKTTPGGLWVDRFHTAYRAVQNAISDARRPKPKPKVQSEPKLIVPKRQDPPVTGGVEDYVEQAQIAQFGRPCQGCGN